ncbi:MAG: hypothetical protein R3F34_13470 [Planctomycetota bacterium]
MDSERGPDGSNEAGFERELRAIGEVTTPERLERDGFRRVRRVTYDEVSKLVERTVDRVIAERGTNQGERNLLVEDTRALLEQVAAGDTDAKVTVLERRVRKLADALDRSEQALADVLDDVDTGLPSARRYVATLLDEHPCAGAWGEAGTLIASRVRPQKLDVDDAERERIDARRSLLRTLAEVNGLEDDAPRPRRPVVEKDDRDAFAELAARAAREDAVVEDDAAPDTESDSAFARLDAGALRLRTEEARPHRGLDGARPRAVAAQRSITTPTHRHAPASSTRARACSGTSRRTSSMRSNGPIDPPGTKRCRPSARRPT